MDIHVDKLDRHNRPVPVLHVQNSQGKPKRKKQPRRITPKKKAKTSKASAIKTND